MPGLPVTRVDARGARVFGWLVAQIQLSRAVARDDTRERALGLSILVMRKRHRRPDGALATLNGRHYRSLSKAAIRPRWLYRR